MEHDLVDRAQRGDAGAFEALVHGVADGLYAIAWRILRDPDRAEEALQQALIRMWENLSGLRDLERFDAWAYRIVVHASYREARREPRWTPRIREIQIDPPDDDRVAAIIDRDELERGFRRLSAEHRAVLVLHYFAGLPVSEIADTLGIPVGTVGSRLHYAVRSLRAAYEADARGVVAWRARA
jgi:RNA polymerase sigma-70 factor (ECF subfamily)